MTAEFGVFFLILALLVSLLQGCYIIPKIRSHISTILPLASLLQALLISLALVTLVVLRLDSDFSVINIASHSNLSLPTLYKIVGTWGNHEGSMLLWVWVLAIFGALVTPHNDSMKLYAISIQSLLTSGFLAFILTTSNPFARRFPPVVDGEALNPLLQDIALAMHPPLLYIGYVGFSIVFSFSISALIHGRADKAWAQTIHPWILASWSALTLGIGLGSWWAYRELGWGGWWFWDPVENASLLPWLAGTALLHSNIVLKKRGQLASWVVLLSIITFGLSLLGTFLVRSGALTSVHSFAADPARGLFILGYIVIVVGGALLLYAIRGAKISSDHELVPASREGMIIINNLFLLTACAAVLLGTLYPMFAEWLANERLTVGPPFFNSTFLPLVTIPLFFAALTPFMAWKKASLRSALKSAQPAALATLAALTFAFTHTHTAEAIAGFALSTWLFIASFQWLIRAKAVRGKYSVFLGHAGAAIIIAGITANSLWKSETEKYITIGESLDIAGYTVTYDSSFDIIAPNFKARRSVLRVTQNNEPITTLKPDYRTYDIKGTKTSETAIYHSLKGDLYSVAGETNIEGKTAIRLYFQPMINLIWLGFLVMAAGGFIALFRARKE